MIAKAGDRMPDGAYDENIAKGPGAPMPGGSGIIAKITRKSEGPCGYCGRRVWAYIAEDAKGMKVAAPGYGVAFVRTRRCGIAQQDGQEVLVSWDAPMVPWHMDCMQWLKRWVFNPSGTAHLVGCRHADPDAHVHYGTRGDVRVELGVDRFCSVCAPIEDWPVAV